jgi:hypothetical protein
MIAGIDAPGAGRGVAQFIAMAISAAWAARMAAADNPHRRTMDGSETW